MSALPKPTTPTLDAVLARGGIWRGNGVSLPPLPGLASGFAALDAVLPGGGWPVGAISEIFPEHEGIGEVSLVLPALARLCQQSRAIAWVLPARQASHDAHTTCRREPTRTHPNHRDARATRHAPNRLAARLLCAPALAAAGLDLSKLLLIEPHSAQESIWALRQIIASKAFGAVVGWLAATDAPSLRRLQIAAEDSPTAVLLFRPARLAHQASPAALKLHLATGGRTLAARQSSTLVVSILKRRGAPVASPICITLGPHGEGDAPFFPHPPSAHAMDRDSSTRPAGAGVLPC